MSTYYNFQERLMMSEGIGGSTDIKDILLSCFPLATKIEKATRSEDKNGVDYWITMFSGHKVGVDVKIREIDYATKGHDDLALETWSMKGEKVGWTRDKQKRTDYIFWYWKDTGRWVLFPFPILCYLFMSKWQEWSKLYKPFTQISNGGQWESECVFVPRKIVWDEYYYIFGGGPKSKKATPGANISLKQQLNTFITTIETHPLEREDEDLFACEQGIEAAEEIEQKRRLDDLLDFVDHWQQDTPQGETA